MKKIIGVFLFFALSIYSNCYAADTTSNEWTTDKGLARVEKIGKNLLTKNSLPTQVNFKVMETDEVNAFASGENEICVYTGLLKFVTDDNELAGIIAHEMGHILNNHVAKQSLADVMTSVLIEKMKLSSNAKQGVYVAQNLTMLKMSRTEEYEADVTGVDLMTKAGYNPLAMVSVLYKISGNYVDFIQTHPSGDKRTMYIYDYITYTYPDKLKSGYNSDSYKQFLEYASPIVQARNANPKKLDAFNKSQKKLKEKRLKKLAKYKNSNSSSGWNASYSFLKSLTTSEQ